MLLVTRGIATRNKDATRGSWPYYYLDSALPIVNKEAAPVRCERTSFWDALHDL